MKYSCGTDVMLGDELLVEYGPSRKALARVVAIGLNQKTNDIDKRYYEWATNEGIIDATTFVVEWVGMNPLEHSNQRLAPVGRYMTLSSLSSEQFLRRQREA